MKRWLMAVGLFAVCATLATAAPVPKALKRAKPVRATIEPLPGEKLHSVDWDDVPFAKVVEELEERSGLLCVTRDLPKVKIKRKAEKVCMPELFALLDEELYPQGWVIARKTQSFHLLQVSELGNEKNRVYFPTLTVNELARRSPWQPAQVLVPVGERNTAVGNKVAAGIDGPGFQASEFGSDKFFVRGRVMDLQKFVDEMGDHVKK